MQAAVVPPVDVLEGGELDLLWRLPRPLALDSDQPTIIRENTSNAKAA